MKEINEFNKYCYNRIKQTGQKQKLLSYECEIEADRLYMGTCYEAASFIIPEDKIILDIGCYMGAQGFLFENHAGYIGIDAFLISDMDNRSFKTKNSSYYGQYLDYGLPDFGNIDFNDIYVLMNAVPVKDWITDKIFETFPNITIAYPYEKTRVKGIYADEMLKYTSLLEMAHPMYIDSYYEKHSSEKYAQLDRYERCLNEIKKYITNKDQVNKVIISIFPDLENNQKIDHEKG